MAETNMANGKPNWILFRDAQALANWLSASAVLRPDALSQGWTVLNLEAGPQGPAFAIAPTDDRPIEVPRRIATRVVEADAEFDPSYSVLQVFSPERLRGPYKVIGGAKTHENAVQAIPLVHWKKEPPDDAEILFWLPSRTELERLVRKHLAVDNHHLQAASATTADGREGWLLRVTRPSWFIVFGEARRDGVETFWRMPDRRVYFAWGWDHPLAAHVKDPGEGAVLMAGPNGWRSFRGGSWRDVADLVAFEVGGRRLEPSRDRLALKVRLGLENRPEPRPPELWIMPWSARIDLEQYLGRLSLPEARKILFADVVHENSGERFLFVKEAISGTGLDARARRMLGKFTAYGMIKGLRGLALPVSKSLVPPLRPERVSALLGLAPEAGLPADLTVVDESGSDDVSITKVPEHAFRTLDKLVESLAGAESEQIRSTIASSTFDKGGLYDVDAPPAKRNRGFVEEA